MNLLHTPEVILHPRPQYFIAPETDNRVHADYHYVHGVRLQIVFFGNRNHHDTTIQAHVGLFLTN